MVKNIKDFGGIFQMSQLSEIKIISLPISFMLLIDEHWLSVFVTENTLEIMDSAGYLRFGVRKKQLRSFLRPLIRFKDFKVSSQLQKDGSNSCGLFAISFLYLRTFTDISLCDFCTFFTDNLHQNEQLIGKIYDVIFHDDSA